MSDTLIILFVRVRLGVVPFCPLAPGFSSFVLVVPRIHTSLLGASRGEQRLTMAKGGGSLQEKRDRGGGTTTGWGGSKHYPDPSPTQQQAQ